MQELDAKIQDKNLDMKEINSRIKEIQELAQKLN